MTNTTEQPSPLAFATKVLGGRMNGQQIRIRELLHVLVKRRTWILLCIIFGLVFGLSLSVLSYVKSQAIKQYTVKTSIALTSQSQSGLFSSQSREPSYTDFYLAEDMVDAAIYILMSDSMLNELIEEVNLLGVTSRDIYNSLSMEQYRQTQIILINLYWENAAEGVRILEAMNRLAPSLLLETLKIGNVTVINNPTARFVIGGNLNLIRNLIIGVFLGIFVGSGLAVLDLIYQPTMLTPSDVNKKLRIPLLGVIAENRSDAPVQAELLEKEDGALPRTVLADSYLALAYSLKRRLETQDHPCVLITSAERGEGKTTVTACLAAALSRIGVRVLAVDFDFRNPMLTGFFFQDLDPLRSVNALYQGKIAARDAVVSVSGTLDILPALLERDPMPLNSAAMELIGLLRDEYDMVLLDTPPVGHFADTMALNTLTENALFVIQYDVVTQAELKEALHRLDSVEISVLGGVVTRVWRKSWDYRDRQREGRKGLPFFKRLKNLRKGRKSRSRAKG